MVIISMTSISMVQLKINAQVFSPSTTGGPIALMLSPAGAVENVLSSHSASSQVILCHLLLYCHHPHNRYKGFYQYHQHPYQHNHLHI